MLLENDCVGLVIPQRSEEENEHDEEADNARGDCQPRQ
jgi:hypothetical protein